MGYVFLKSDLERLENAPTPELRRAALQDMIDGYNRYRKGMRSGLFGFFIGRALFPESKDRQYELHTQPAQKDEQLSHSDGQGDGMQDGK